MGDDLPGVPNKRGGAVCIGNKIAPIFFNVIEVYPYEGVIKAHGTGEVLTNFKVKTDVIFDEVQAGGRIPLIIGRGLTSWARDALGMPPSTAFRSIGGETPSAGGYSLAQKMVGK